MSMSDISASSSTQKLGEKPNEGKSGNSSFDWRKLFSAAEDQSLQYFPPQRSDGGVRVSLPAEVFDEGKLLWKNAVVAQFVGKIPNFSYFQKMVNLLWGEDGDVDIRPAGHNLFLLQFFNTNLRDRVLENGPWHIQGKPLIVRKWEPSMKSLEFNMAKLPIWIQLGNIPLELFTQKGISYIASALGNPLYTDRITASQKRLAFARVCVEIDASTEVPRCIEVEMKDGSTVQVHVQIPWLPMKCTDCCIFGHSAKTCPRQVLEQKKVWVPKRVAPEGKITVVEEITLNEDKFKQGEEKSKETEDVVCKTNMDLTASSVNKFQILESVLEVEEEVHGSETSKPLTSSDNCLDNSDAVLEEKEAQDDHAEHIAEDTTTAPRKLRAAAAGVADLMKTLKAKKKGPIDMAKHRKGGSQISGSQSSSPP